MQGGCMLACVCLVLRCGDCGGCSLGTRAQVADCGGAVRKPSCLHTSGGPDTRTDSTQQLARGQVGSASGGKDAERVQQLHRVHLCALQSLPLPSCTAPAEPISL
jgi:hypothetical protein